MAAVAPAHYIRTIHTSFTAAHPRNAHAAPAAWAVRSAHPVPKDREAHVPHAPYQHQQQHQAYPAQPVSISTHNAHYYTHHLQALAPPPQGPSSASVPMRRRPGSPSTAGAGPGPAGAGGRRRSVSIRMPPSYAPSTRGRTGTAAVQAYKFDPFADDEAPPAAPLSVTSPLTGGFAANRGAPHERTEALYGSAGAPYTIHIPAAQPTEIQQYTPPPTPSAAPRSARLRSLIPINGPLPGTAPTTLARTTTLASTHPPSARTTLTRSPSPPTTTGSATPTTRMGAPQPPPNLSKIVAGILLNRVHAVGKPMRRRVLPAVGAGAAAGGYRKSCLSSVISLEL